MNTMCNKRNKATLAHLSHISGRREI
uniref:Uncharacterized protein n=1 Tax=Arundo donax TaxID=35708 RepID=A0A0A9FI57_ARUDO